MASCWLVEINSAGFFMSPMLAMVIIHLKVGAQKKTVESQEEEVLLVNGPAG